MNLILEDDINNIDARTYLMTHTTNPFLAKATIINAIQSFAHAKNKSGIDSLSRSTSIKHVFIEVTAAQSIMIRII